LHALSDIRAVAGSQLAASRANTAASISDVKSAARTGIQEARRRLGEAHQDIIERARLEATDRRLRSRELFREVELASRNTLRWGAEAAEATFREVVAQGPEKTLGRGFAVVHDRSGQIVTSAARAGSVQDIQVQFQDGTVEASVARGKEES
jgi:exodeoxyribonuclease VII large subunit